MRQWHEDPRLYSDKVAEYEKKFGEDPFPSPDKPIERRERRQFKRGFSNKRN